MVPFFITDTQLLNFGSCPNLHFLSVLMLPLASSRKASEFSSLALFNVPHSGAPLGVHGLGVCSPYYPETVVEL